MQNEDKNEAENEFQLLFESARQTMHSEPRKLKSPRARSKKSKRASPKQGAVDIQIKALCA